MALTYTAVVAPRATASTIDNYLYGHTNRALTFQTEEGVFCILATQGDVHNVKYLAEYQIGRLQSGLFGAYGPDENAFVLLIDADVVYAAKRIGVDLEKVTDAIEAMPEAQRTALFTPVAVARGSK